MNCIKCDRELPDHEEGVNQPAGGTEFVTYGHYGSTVTDLMDGTIHIVNVCDECLSDALRTGHAQRKASAVSEEKSDG